MSSGTTGSRGALLRIGYAGDAGAAARPASTAHYKKMYDRASALARIGVWECDLATEALTWTDGVYDLFELPRGAPVDRATPLALYEDESRREMEELRARAIEEGGSFSLDVRIRTAKGNERWIRLTADVELENGRPVRIFGTKQDITAERSAQDKVRALQAEIIHMSRRSAMGAMAATLGHELNQPLAAISNYVAGTRRALARPALDTQMLESGLAAIEQSADRAGRIIRSLRDMTSGSAVKRQVLNPNPLIHEAASLAMLGIEMAAEARFDLAEDIKLAVDPIQIQQVLINLIKNAFEAVRTSARREVTISTYVAEGEARIRVDDSGHGIAPELRDSLFESFVSSKPDGIGVGLSISRTIVEAHGGGISAWNRETGGASFCVALPLAGKT
jgi:two-component system, LuxR family, sensor kinase FixL